MKNENAVYLLNKLIGYEKEQEELRAKLLHDYNIDVTYIDEEEILIAVGIGNFGYDLKPVEMYPNHKCAGFEINGTTVYQIIKKCRRKKNVHSR